MKRLIFVMLTLPWLATASDFTIYPTSVSTNSGGTGNGCPGQYAWFANYTKTAAAGWGWKEDTNSATHSATYVNGGGVKVQYGFKTGLTGCDTNAVVVLSVTNTACRFTVYGPVGSTAPGVSNAPLTLSGFLP